jgi:hypothetical protein
MEHIPMHEITVTAIPSAGLVALDVDDHAVLLRPSAAMQAGLLMAKASIQAVAATADNLEGFATMLDQIDKMLATLVAS